jgi:hypothetical protein
MKTEAQCKQILRFLKSGGEVTTLQAIRKFGSIRLPARIWDLRQAGHAIDRQMVEVGEGKRVASYSMRKRAA